jgi:hypothetical protein
MKPTVVGAPIDGAVLQPRRGQLLDGDRAALRGGDASDCPATALEAGISLHATSLSPRVQRSSR